MNKIKNLELEIIKHKNLYYQGKPEISDEEYDQIEEELSSLDPNNQVLKIVGSTILSGDKVEHETKMLSLNKTYKLGDLVSWADSRNVVSTFKIDGSSCSLVYKDGSLNIGKTRGDGRFGENILNKVLCLENLPKEINNLKNIEVRGEIYCTDKNFVNLSKEMEALGLDKPTSKRNIVAGLLGRKENYELSRYLSFQAFELIEIERSTLKTEVEKFLLLKKLGFQTPEYKVNKTTKDFELRLSEAATFIEHGDYLIDGIVFTLNELSQHEEMGQTAHHPRYKMAFKFQGETRRSLIESISWQVSRNGFLTPVANITPVELSGAMVSRVTLHNYGVVRDFELKSGDEIEVVRSGEVIPKFLGVFKRSNNPFTVPVYCPSCKEKVFEEEIRLICKNEVCPDKVKDEILNFIQKIGIDDLSGKRLEELIKSGLVLDIPSIYDLKKDDLLKLDKIKDKLADKILNNIEMSKNINLINFLASLGISGGAYNKCEKIVLNGFNTIEKIMALTVDELCCIESFAEKSSSDFVNSLSQKKIIIEKLLTKNFKFKKIETIVGSKILGLKFCITGTLSMKRADLQKMIKDAGGIIVSSVTKNTNYVISNDEESSSSKFKKAKALEIPILNETNFKKMIES